MNLKYLTTGQAASRCSVSSDTVLKWIRSGLLPALRTAGGHHRISERDLDLVLRPPEPTDEHSSGSSKRRQFRYCWEYNGNGKLLDSCTDCSVYQMRAQRCYDVPRFAPDAGPPRKFCKVTCEDCDYYQLVHEQTTNILVITDNAELTCALKDKVCEAPYNLEFADCEYSCSAVVNRFRPDFAIIDCSLGPQVSRDITHHLSQDPRIPFVRVVLAGNDDEFPKECEKKVFALIERPFDIQDIKECIGGIDRNRPE